MIPIKKPLILLVFTLLAGVVAVANPRQTRQEYINRYKHIAVEHMNRYGIPASITMAQGILESDSGNSLLSTKSNNHFGIKCKSNWTGASVTHDDDQKGECFRAYPTVELSYRDHADFLNSSPRYDSLFDLSSSDYKSWARGLKKAGYATAPEYAHRLIKLIEDNDLYLLDQENGIQKYADIHGGELTPPSMFAATAGGIDPDNFTTTINGHKGYNVYRRNDVFFIVTKNGDTYTQIAEFFDISERRLRKYNDLSRRAPIQNHEVVYIAKKGNKWREATPTRHTVKRGETIQSVAQEYAITVDALRRLNKNEIKHTLYEGQVLKLK